METYGYQGMHLCIKKRRLPTKPEGRLITGVLVGNSLLSTPRRPIYVVEGVGSPVTN